MALLFCPMTFIMYSYVSDGLKAKPPASACMNIVDLLSVQHLSSGVGKCPILGILDITL